MGRYQHEHLIQIKVWGNQEICRLALGKHWISCIETDKADIGMVSGYDVIILGGGIYASGIAGLSFFKKNIDKLKDRKLIVFCCGASPFDQEAYEAVVDHNMKGALEGIPCFYCRGAWNENEMTFRDRTLCRMLQKAVAKQNPEEYEPCFLPALLCVLCYL